MNSFNISLKGSRKPEINIHGLSKKTLETLYKTLTNINGEIKEITRIELKDFKRFKVLQIQIADLTLSLYE